MKAFGDYTEDDMASALKARDYKDATDIIVEPMIIDGTRVDDVRIYQSPVQTLKARMGTGGNNVPMVATDETILFDADRRVGARVFEDGIAPTLMAFMGTGGNNVPMVAADETAIPIQDGREIDKHQNGLGVGNPGDPSYTLDQTGAQAVAYPIQGTIIGRSDTAGPQGRGVGEDGDPMYTLDTISAHGVAYTSSSFASYQEGVGTLRANGGDLGGGSESLIVAPDIAPTLRSGGDGGVPSSRGEHLIVEAYDEYNDALGGNIHQALRAGTKQSTGVLTDMVVRRLTPIECERLMGWPENHTLHRADGKQNSDTTRYKMCGNGVASPVAQWIAEHILDVDRTF
jgi:DNA (cytosine-5)-methyltransferase 1